MTGEQTSGMSDREAFLTMLMRMTAHDLNNILSPILGYPELLMESFPEGSQEQEDLIEIQDLANRAILLIKDVQQLIRRELTEKKPCILQDEIRAVFTEGALTKDMQSRVDKTNIQLNLDDDLPRIGSTRHVLAGLLKNLFTACLFTAPDGGNISVTPFAEEGRMVLKVETTIHKLQQDEVDRLIEPFFLRKRYSTHMTGLELTVVQELMNQHGGTFTYDLNGDLLTLILCFPGME